MIDHTNPLAVSLPYTFSSANDFPTEVLANRFQAWRSILKDLLIYLKEYASVQEEIVRQQQRLQQAVGSVASQRLALLAQQHHHQQQQHDDMAATNKYFLPIGNGSIQDLPNVLTKFHLQNVTNGSKTLKDINNIIIPKLEELRKDLLIKIKEIKNLQNDFKTNLGREIQETKTLLQQYQHAIELSNKLEHGIGSAQSAHLHVGGSGGLDGLNDQSKHDPFLVKVKLDRQLKRQLNEESYLYDAYANLQNSGGKLESIVVLEIQNFLGMFLNLVENEHATIPNYLIPNINQGFLSKDPGFEWDSFISRHLSSQSAVQQQHVGINSGSQLKSGTFIDLSFPARKLSDLRIPNFDTPLNVSIRESFLERRSKFLKSYSSGWYVLTCNYVHEFKSPDRKKDPQPVMSLLLDQCLVSEHSKDDGKAGGVYKFVLYSKGLNIRHRSHNWVFRTDTYKNMIDWYNDIKSLTSLATPAARARWVAKKAGDADGFHIRKDGTKVPSSQRVSRTSSILSSGTNARTIKSIETGESGAHNLAKTQSVRSKTASTANQRLSSTFSSKINNQLPRLPNMINSDGTIITPVESHYEQEEYLRNIQKPQQQDQQQLPNQPNQQGYAVNSSPLPPQPQSSNSTPQQFIYPGNYYYTANGTPIAVQPGQVVGGQPNGVPQAPQAAQGQPQQFYDVAKQQYFTLTTSAQPQPQYFPTSPQPPSQQYYAVPGGQTQPQVVAGQQGQPGQVYAINAAHYIPTSPLSQPHPHFNDATSLGSYLPGVFSGAGGTAPIVKDGEHPPIDSQVPHIVTTDTSAIARDGGIIISNEDLHDEVTTLPSVGSDKEE